MDVRYALVVGSLALFLCVSVGEAYDRGYGPFEPGAEAPSVPLRECVRVRAEMESDGQTPHTVYYASSKHAISPLLRMQRAGDDGWRITILDENGVSLLPAPAVNAMVPLLHDVYIADLNADGSPDYIVSNWSGGCGLGAEICDVTFLLSQRGGRYEASGFSTFDFGPHDIVRLTATGPCYFIHTEFVGNGDEKTKDGRDHNFWVYQIYRIDGSQLVLANADDRRFPKWVWYTFRENHRETDQLTAAQKQRLLPKRSATAPTN